MNTALAAMAADGTYQAIYDEWFDAPAGSILYEEMAPAAIGTEENPIQVLFVPSVSAEEIIAGGAVLAEALNTATGLFFEVSVPTSYAATIEAMCASPDNTIGFIPANAYVLANELCGVTPALKSLRYGYTEYWAEVIVPRDSDIDSLDDLNGKTWAYPDSTSTSGFLVPSGMFAALGITPGRASRLAVTPVRFVPSTTMRPSSPRCSSARTSISRATRCGTAPPRMPTSPPS